MADLQVIQDKIYEIRGQRVMLDRDLAEMYGVTTSALNQSVKRNAQRFPEEFMFRISKTEWENMSSQFVTTSRTKRPKTSFTQNPYRNTGLHLCCESICCDAYLPHDYDIRNSCRSS